MSTLVLNEPQHMWTGLPTRRNTPTRNEEAMFDDNDMLETPQIDFGPKGEVFPIKQSTPAKAYTPPINYFGAQGGFSNQEFDPNDILETPTINWADDDSDTEPDIHLNTPEDGGLGTPTINWKKDTNVSSSAKNQSADSDLLIAPSFFDV